jgi:hypothetical protein
MASIPKDSMSNKVAHDRSLAAITEPRLGQIQSLDQYRSDDEQLKEPPRG